MCVCMCVEKELQRRQMEEKKKKKKKKKASGMCSMFCLIKRDEKKRDARECVCSLKTHHAFYVSPMFLFLSFPFLAASCRFNGPIYRLHGSYTEYAVQKKRSKGREGKGRLVANSQSRFRLTISTFQRGVMLTACVCVCFVHECPWRLLNLGSPST